MGIGVVGIVLGRVALHAARGLVVPSLLVLAACGNQVIDPPPTGCELLPDEVRSLLGTSDWTTTATELTRGPDEDGLVARCTLSSQDEKNRVVRLTVRPLTDQQVEVRRQQLTANGAPPCAGGRRFEKDGGSGLACPEDIVGATVTRMVSLWGDLEVGTQVVRPGPAEARDSFRLYGLARVAADRCDRWRR